MPQDNGCEICQEFASRTCPFLSPPKCRLLYDGADFAVFPSLGSFVEGYLLVCPKDHIPSSAWLDQEGLSNLERLLTTVKHIVRNHYTDPVVFEHGMTKCGENAGGCIDHAHLHVVPGTVDLVGILAEQFVPEVLSNWLELSTWRTRPYLLAQPNRGPTIICEVRGSLPGQFLRRRVAAALGVPDIWDWGAYLGIREIHQTIERLAPAFACETAAL